MKTSKVFFFLFVFFGSLWPIHLQAKLLEYDLASPIVQPIDTNQWLADTLNYFFHQGNINVGKVKVSSYTATPTQITIHTNSVLKTKSFSPAELDTMRAVIGSILRPNSKCKVLIYTDTVELTTLITARFQSRPKKERHTIPTETPLITNVSAPYVPNKGLDKKHIALWGSHGLYYNQELEVWKWQRARLWTTVEDLYTSSYTRNYLAPMLQNAGAIVLQPRETDTQLEEIIVDENQTIKRGFDFSSQKGAGWGLPNGSVLKEGENPFMMGGYLMANCKRNSKSTLRYIPYCTKEGQYAVYISYQTLPNSTPEAKYTVMHNGVATTYSVNQTMGGGTWIYLGKFYFGTNPRHNYVEVSNEGSPHKVVTSDAVRFGGGVGNVARYPNPVMPSQTNKNHADILLDSILFAEQLAKNKELAETSGVPRFAEGARYWLQYAGIPDTVYNYSQSINDYTDDYCCRGRWVNYLAGGSASNPKEKGLNIPIHLSMAFHSDAGTFMNDSSTGTLTIYTEFDNDKNKNYAAGGSRQSNRDFADYMMHQIVSDMRATYAPEWPQRYLYSSSYAESRYPKVPSVLLELLSHQNYGDMYYGLDPRVKFTVSRAIYKSILRFLHAQYNTPYVVQPLPIKNFAIKRTHDTLKLTWEEQVDSLEPTAKPTFYVLYKRINDTDWDNGQKITKNNYQFVPSKNTQYDFKVLAGNEGGVSMPSEVLSAHIASQEKGNCLIINAFTRVGAPDMFGIDSLTGGAMPYSQAVPEGEDISYIGDQFEYDRMLPWKSDDECGFAMCFCDKQFEPTMGNTFDYPAMHGKVLARLGYSYISTSIGALNQIDPKVDMVDIILGKQRQTTFGKVKQHTDFKTFTPDLRQALTDYTQRGGKILVAGSYIGSDMLQNEDTTFTKQVLHYAYKTYRASNSGLINVKYLLPKRQYEYYASPNSTVIQCEAPDGIEPTYGAKRLARYADSQVCAGIAYEGAYKVIALPFVLESVKQFDRLYQDCVEWLFK